MGDPKQAVQKIIEVVPPVHCKSLVWHATSYHHLEATIKHLHTG